MAIAAATWRLHLNLNREKSDCSICLAPVRWGRWCVSHSGDGDLHPLHFNCYIGLRDNNDPENQEVQCPSCRRNFVYLSPANFVLWHEKSVAVKGIMLGVMFGFLEYPFARKSQGFLSVMTNNIFSCVSGVLLAFNFSLGIELCKRKWAVESVKKWEKIIAVVSGITFFALPPSSYWNIPVSALMGMSIWNLVDSYTSRSPIASVTAPDGVEDN
jgi:hypothetical protein